MAIKTSLINANDCVLVVIDIQDSFLDKYIPSHAKNMVEKSVWMIEAARAFGIPIVVMGEEISNMGELNAQIMSALPGGTHVHDKDAFGLADNPEILAAVKSTSRNTAIVLGMETDVCVSQSALGLIGLGYEVVVVADATITTEGDQQTGLNRMSEAGATISSVKAIYYEWLGSVTRSFSLDQTHPELRANRPDCLKM